MKDYPRNLDADALPELPEQRVAELLRLYGLDAFVRCSDIGECVNGVGTQDCAFAVSLIRFPGGFLKLTRGHLPDQRPECTFVAVDFCDYRAAVLDQSVVEDAYRRFATYAQAYADAAGSSHGIVLECCPNQGTAFVALGEAVDDIGAAPLCRFLASYFNSSSVVRDLHRAFGEATIAFAKATVPSLAAVLTM